MRALAPSRIVNSPATVVLHRRGKSLARRKHQEGQVYQKGRKRSDGWLPKEPAYVQFWADVPGQHERRRQKLALGIHRTRTAAERAAAEKLEQLGINSAQTFIEATSNVTFQQQGDIWLKSLANRKRDPLEQTTIDPPHPQTAPFKSLYRKRAPTPC
jgi:hypothetical protein